MLRSSLAATLRWLQQAAESSTSIQIMTLLFRDNSEQSLESFFLRLQRQGVDLQNIMVYRVVRANSMAYVVLYGSYPDRPAATDAIRGLPETLKDNRPIVRTLIGVRSDIEDSLK
jgi:septal ring-binding cell division protein DamX